MAGDTTLSGYPRFEAYLPVQCTAPTPGQPRPRELTGKTRSVSAGGLEILLPESLPLRTPVLVRIGEGEPLRAYVVSVHQGRPSPIGIKVPHGLAFEKPVDPVLVRQWVYRAERQSHARAPVQFPVEYHRAGTAGRGTCLNLSRGGMFIATKQPAPPDAQVSLTFTLPNLSHTFTVLARVVWTRGEQTEPSATIGMGVQFLDPRPSESALIGSVVDRHGDETLSSFDSSRSGPSPR